MFWIKSGDLDKYDLANDFEDMFKIFNDDDLQEFQWVEENNQWIKKIY